MICYRDRTFCSETSCDNKECPYLFTDEDKEKAEKWWEGSAYPVALSKLRHSECGYVKKQNVLET